MGKLQKMLQFLQAMVDSLHIHIVYPCFVSFHPLAGLKYTKYVKVKILTIRCIAR